MSNRIETLKVHLGASRERRSVGRLLPVDVANKVVADKNADLYPLDAQSLFSMKGKICLVTGGSKGIGKMIAAGLCANGAKVYVCSRKAELCASAATELNVKYGSNGSSAHALPGDLSSFEGVEKVVAALREKERRVSTSSSTMLGPRTAPITWTTLTRPGKRSWI